MLNGRLLALSILSSKFLIPSSLIIETSRGSISALVAFINYRYRVHSVATDRYHSRSKHLYVNPLCIDDYFSIGLLRLVDVRSLSMSWKYQSAQRHCCWVGRQVETNFCLASS
ncbi:hypothetical protein C8J56DRAFT_965142 [Mycena floridula]|nr:hypothetical protein C8J56DRAFT_965142 [Mycena floridula]